MWLGREQSVDLRPFWRYKSFLWKQVIPKISAASFLVNANDSPSRYRLSSHGLQRFVRFRYAVGLVLLGLLSYLVYGYVNPVGSIGLSEAVHRDTSIEKAASALPLEAPQLENSPIVEKDLPPAARKPINYRPRSPIDESGYLAIMRIVAPWPKETSLLSVSKRFQGAAKRAVADIDRYLLKTDISTNDRSIAEFTRASFLNFDGDPDKAYESLVNSRRILESAPELAEKSLFTIIYFQGVTALRKGENENCIMCRGESSCQNKMRSIL